MIKFTQNIQQTQICLQIKNIVCLQTKKTIEPRKILILSQQNLLYSRKILITLITKNLLKMQILKIRSSSILNCQRKKSIFIHRHQIISFLFSQMLKSWYIKKFTNGFNKYKRFQKILQPYHFNIINDDSTPEALLQLFLQIKTLLVQSTQKNSVILKSVDLNPTCLDQYAEQFVNLTLFSLKKIALQMHFLEFPLYPLNLLLNFYGTFQSQLAIFFYFQQYHLKLHLTIIFFLTIINYLYPSSQHSCQQFQAYYSKKLNILDIFLNFNTAYYEYGQIVNKRSLIIKNYIKNDLVFDLFSIISFVTITILNLNAKYIAYQDNKNPKINYENFVMLSIFFQIKNIAKMIQKFEESQSFSNKARLLMDLLKIILILIYSEHIFSCIWYFVGIQGQQYQIQNWIDSNDLKQSGYLEKYIASFYFSTVTMISVGYGDIVPKNSTERVVVILFMFCSTMQLSYTVSTIWTITTQINEKKEQQTKKLRSINHYMQRKKISFPLQFKVREYLNYLWQEQSQDQNNEEIEIVDQLSQVLKDNLMMEAYSLVLKDCSLFSNYFSEDLKKQCLNLIQNLTLFPENTVDSTLKNQFKDDSLIFFIEEGEVEVSLNGAKKGKKHAILQRGDNFGLVEFITGEPYWECFKSIGFTRLLYLSRKQFLQILNNFPEDYEKFCMLKDQMTFSPDLPRDLAIRCYSCNSLDHMMRNCPILHYTPDREFILKRNCYNPVQQRKVKLKQRKKLVKFQTFLDRDFLAEVAEAYQLQNEKIIDRIVPEEEKLNKQQVSQPIHQQYTIPEIDEQSDNNDSSCSSSSSKKRYQRKQSIMSFNQKMSRRQSQRLDIFRRQSVKNESEEIRKRSSFALMAESYNYKILENKLKERIDKTDKNDQELIESMLLKQKQSQDRYFGSLDGLESEFEAFRLFKIYFPLYNLSQVILNLGQQKRTDHTDLDKLIKYFFFPYEFIKKYRLFDQAKSKEETEVIRKRNFQQKQRERLSAKINKITPLNNNIKRKEKRKTKAFEIFYQN